MEQAFELVEQLANQLGVAVEYLWATLTRQHFAEGVTDIVWAVFEVAMVILLAVYAPKLTKKADDEYKRLLTDRKTNHTGFNGSLWVSSFEEDRWNACRKWIPISAVIIGVILFFGAGYDITCGIQKLINPDYFALKEVLDVISSG